MAVSVHLFIVVLALVMFLLAGLGIPQHPRFQFVPFGLFFWLLSTLVIR